MSQRLDAIPGIATTPEIQNSVQSGPVEPKSGGHPRLLDQMRQKLRLLHYSVRTEQSYLDWVTRFLKFHRDAAGVWKHPRELRLPEITQFLTDLAVVGKVAASTQNQALAALLFLYQHVLEIDLPMIDAVRAQRPERLPTVLCVDEIRQVLAAFPAGSVYRLMAELMYGSGLRVMECCRLRVKDIDFPVVGQFVFDVG